MGDLVCCCWEVSLEGAPSEPSVSDWPFSPSCWSKKSEAGCWLAPESWDWRLSSWILVSSCCFCLQYLYKASEAIKTSAKVSVSAIILMISVSSPRSIKILVKLPILNQRFVRSARFISSIFSSASWKKSWSASSLYPLKKVLARPG